MSGVDSEPQQHESADQRIERLNQACLWRFGLMVALTLLFASTAPAGSIAAAQQAREAELAADDALAQQKLALGEQAEQAGRPALARGYYQVALRYARKAALKDQIQASLDALSRTPSRVSPLR